MKTSMMIAVVLLGFISFSTIGLASVIIGNDNIAHYENGWFSDPIIYNNNLKIELHYDNNGVSSDGYPCEDNCAVQPYDYVIDPSTSEKMAEFSMFKLQRQTGNQWKDIQVTSNKYENCSTDGVACVKRVMELKQNTYMNVSYILNDNSDKVKFVIDVIAGQNKDYRLKYTLNSLKNISSNQEKTVEFDKFFYDWNDITTHATTYSINGNLLEQITILGSLNKDQYVQIDPIIQATSAPSRFGYRGGNIIEVSGNNTYVLSANSTNLLMYKSTDEGATWNLQATSTPSIALGTYYPVTMMKENNMMHIITWDSLGNYYKYRTYNLTSDAFTSYINITEYTITTPTQMSSLELITTANATHDALCWQMWTTKPEVNCIYRTTGTTDASFTNSQVHWNITSANSNNPLLAQYQTGSQKYLMSCNGNLTSTYCRDFTPNNLTLKSTYNTLGGPYANSLIELDVGTLRIFAGNPTDSTTFSNSTRAWNVTWEREINLTTEGAIANYKNINKDLSGYCHFVGRADPLASADQHYVYKTSTNTNCQFDHLVPEYNMTWLDVKEPSQSDIDRQDFTINQYPRYANQVSLVYMNNSILYFNKAPLGLTISAYNEETNALLTAWNVYIYNTTNSDTQNGINFYSKDWSGTNILVQPSKTDFATRNYYITIANYGDYYPMNVYLLNSTNGNFVRFHIYDIWGNILPNTTFTVKRSINSTLTEVERTITGTTGVATVFLSPIVTYTVTSSNPNCTNYTSSDMYTSTDYSIQMVCAMTGNYTAPVTLWDNLTMATSPLSLSLCNTTQPFYFYINDTDGRMTSYSANITNSTGSLLWSSSGSNANGGNLSTSIDLSGYDGRLTMSWSWTRTPFNTVYGSKGYFISRYYCSVTGYNTTLLNTIGEINSSGIGEPFLIVLALLLSFTAVGITSYLGTGMFGGSLIFVSVFSLLAFVFDLFPDRKWILFLMIGGAGAVVVLQKVG